MKKLFATAAVIAVLMTSAAVYAHDAQDQTPQGEHHGMFDKLPPADAQQIHDAMKKAHEDNKPLMVQEKKLHDDIRGILTADQFDEKAFIAKQAKLETLHDKIKTHMTLAFAGALAQLSPDDRKIIADSMQDHHHWHHDKVNWHKDGTSKPPAPEQSEQ